MHIQNSLKERIERWKTFYGDKGRGQILASISPYTFELDYSRWGIEDRPLNSWDFEKDAEAYADYNIKKLRCFMEYTRSLDNDFLPAVAPHLGAGVHSAYLSGADVTFGQDTSWVHPVVNEWEDMAKLVNDPSNKWVKIIKRMLLRFMEICEEDYFTMTFPHYGPTDMANALRGNQIFYDYFDYPEKVKELLGITADAIIWMEKELRKITRKVDGGSAVADMWMPGDSLYMSEDNSDLSSPEIYREFGRPCMQRVIDELGGAYIHHHAKGLHIHRDISGLKGLKAVEISWDPNCPRPIDNLENIIGLSNGLPLMTRCTARDVYQHIDALKKGRIILMLNVESLEEGREVMKFIRKNSRV